MNIGAFGDNYIRSLREHMVKEEDKLFPMAEILLTAEEWRMIDAAINTIDDPLFDEMTAVDYERLFRLITEQSALSL